jgi:L-asparaginase II
MAERTDAAELVRIIRDPLVECVHRGHVAIWHHDIGLIAGWGDTGGTILPRSADQDDPGPAACGKRRGGCGRPVGGQRLALACASHQGAAIHTDMVSEWLSELGLGESDLRCGPQMPSDEDAAHAMIRAYGSPDQRHNNCSGKHSGFLTLSRHLGGGPEYLEIDHPVQRAVRAALQDLSGEPCDDMRSTDVPRRISRCRWKVSRGHSPHSPPRRTPACVARRCAASPRR